LHKGLASQYGSLCFAFALVSAQKHSLFFWVELAETLQYRQSKQVFFGFN